LFSPCHFDKEKKSLKVTMRKTIFYSLSPWKIIFKVYIFKQIFYINIYELINICLSAWRTTPSRRLNKCDWLIHLICISSQNFIIVTVTRRIFFYISLSSTYKRFLLTVKNHRFRNSRFLRNTICYFDFFIPEPSLVASRLTKKSMGGG